MTDHSIVEKPETLDDSLNAELLQYRSELSQGLNELAGNGTPEHQAIRRIKALIASEVKKARIDELEPYSVHVVECESVKAFQVQKEWHEDDFGKRTYIGKDPLDCFDYLCDCGALKIINRIASLKDNQGEAK